jgi:hypothetical protein
MHKERGSSIMRPGRWRQLLGVDVAQELIVQAHQDFEENPEVIDLLGQLQAKQVDSAE